MAEDSTEKDVVTTVQVEGGILVGHDGSRPAGEAVAWAARMASRLGLPLHVLRAWALTTAPRPASMTGGYVPPLTDFEQAVIEEVRADLASRDLPEGLEVHVHAAHRKSATALLEAARGAEMLVVGARGAGGFRGRGVGAPAAPTPFHERCRYA